MKEIKNHLQDIHKSEAEHHSEMAGAMTTLANHHDSLGTRAEISDPSGWQIHKAAAEACRSLAAHHVAHAEKCLRLHKAAGELSDTLGPTSDKAAAGEVDKLLAGISKLLNGPMPMSVSVMPMTDSRQAVPRFGQRDPNTADLTKGMDPALRCLVDGNEART
jgi:hypothetical protein